jgi:hypothetical protein
LHEEIVLMRRIILLGMVGGVIAAILFAAGPVMGKSQPGRVAWIQGTGDCGSGCYFLDVRADLFKDSSTTGSVQCATDPSELSTCAEGPVMAVVPPASGSHTWCITVRRSDVDTGFPQNVNWYIRDVGDGRTSFDQISFVTGYAETTGSAEAVNCQTFPDTPGSWVTLTKGDFKAVDRGAPTMQGTQDPLAPTGGPAILLPAAALLLGAGMLTYAILNNLSGG